ncbi:unnamed protein product [Allacma fusca]|uniref:Uncharacterized protein n=1 Tax=Allacma fusca TaxID=39272 RepID=A0A8J2LUH9_9HEXA|nr:unnamed protein product [Allacma fusca]
MASLDSFVFLNKTAAVTTLIRIETCAGNCVIKTFTSKFSTSVEAHTIRFDNISAFQKEEFEMNSSQPLHSRGYSDVSVPKSRIFGKDIRSWKTFTWEEKFLVAVTTATLVVSVALLCAFVEQQFSLADWVFTTLNLIGYCRFGFILYYVIYGLLNEESFAMIALAGSLFLQLMLASYINVVNWLTKFGFSDTIDYLYLVSLFVTPIAVIASAILACRYWKQSLPLFLNIDDIYVENFTKTCAIGRSRLILKSLLAFEIQWSLVCLTVVIQQWRESKLEDSIALTVGFLVILLRVTISWILIGRRLWRALELILVLVGFVVVPSHFVYFYLKLVEPPGCIPLSVSALFLMLFIFLNHILIFAITDASSSCARSERKRGVQPGENYNLLSISSQQGTASTTVNLATNS